MSNYSSTLTKSLSSNPIGPITATAAAQMSGKMPMMSVGVDGYSVTTISNSNNYNGALKVHGDGLDLEENSDIKIGNTSLKEFMQTVSTRLAMLTPNPAMEKEWEELKALGDAYRALEKECIDKSKVWNILKK